MLQSSFTTWARHALTGSTPMPLTTETKHTRPTAVVSRSYGVRGRRGCNRQRGLGKGFLGLRKVAAGNPRRSVVPHGKRQFPSNLERAQRKSSWLCSSWADGKSSTSFLSGAKEQKMSPEYPELTPLTASSDRLTHLSCPIFWAGDRRQSHHNSRGLSSPVPALPAPFGKQCSKKSLPTPP